MKKMLMRPTAAFFPLALIGAYLFGWKHLTMVFTIAYFLLQICSLCAVDAFRNAAAREPSPVKMDQRFGASILPMVAGLGVGALVMYHLDDLQYYFLLGAAWLIIIEQLFEERLFCLNRDGDGLLLSFISNALLMTALILDGVDGIPTPLVKIDFGFYTLCAAFVSVLIGLAVNLMAAPFRGFAFAPKNLLFAPKAMVQTLLYPALAFALCRMTVDTGSPYGYLDFQTELINSLGAFLPGLLLWRLCRTVCRRSQDESKTLNLQLLLACALAFLLYLAVEGSAFIFLNCVLVLICAMIVYLAPSVRLYIGAAVCILALAFDPHLPPASIVLALAIAVALNMKNVFLKKV